MIDDITLTNKSKSTSQCESCNTDKSKLKLSRRSQNSIYEKNAMFDSNLDDSINSSTWDDKNYYCLKRNRTTELLFLYLYVIKNEFFTNLKNDFMLMIKTQTSDYFIKRWRFDENDEIKSKRVDKFFKKHDVLWKSSASYAKQQNEVSERENYTVMNAIRVILKNSDLSAFLWSEILKTIVYLRNKFLCTRLRVQHVTLYEVYFDKRSKLSHLRLIDCDAWLTLFKKRSDQKKLSSREIKCKFLRYADTNQYRLWNFIFRRVITARDVHFDESYMLKYFNKIYNWTSLEYDDQSKNEIVDSNDQNTFTADIDNIDDERMTSQSNQNRKSNFANSAKNDEITSNSEDSISNDADDVNMSFDNVNSNSDKSSDIDFDDRILHSNSHSNFTIVERKSIRSRNSSTKSRLNEHLKNLSNWDKQISMIINKSYYENLVKASTLIYCRQITVVKNSDFAYDHDMNFENDFRELIELTQAYSVKVKAFIDEKSLTIKEALSDSYVKKHKAALNAEMIAHKKMKTYERVRLSSVSTETKILTSKVVFKIKRDLKDEILKFKTRWCVTSREFEQFYDVNFNETYVSIVKFMFYKAIFAITAKKNLNVEQMNIVIAFLNSILKKRIYIWSSEDFEKKDWIWILRRALYDLKQSSREWYQILSTFLKSQRFEHLKSNHFVFINKKLRLIVSIYVNDLLIIESREFKTIKKLKQILSKRFSMTDLNSCHHYLNMIVTRDREKKTLSLSQSTYIQKILTRFDMKDCKSISTSMKVETNLKVHENYKAIVQQVKKYQTIVDFLIYLWIQTRSNISFAVQKLTRYNLNSSEATMTAAKRVLRYLQDTKNLLITYEKNDDFDDYIDADHADDLSTRRSTDVYLFTLHESAIIWSSKLQTCVTLSSCEVEYMTQTQTSKKVIWIAQLLKKLNLSFDLSEQSVTIKADNQRTIALAENSKFHSRTKHIDVQWHFVREQMNKRAILFEYCSTNEMTADELTKSLDKIKFNRFVDQMSLRK